MNRRSYLSAVGVAGVGAVGGCLGGPADTAAQADIVVETVVDGLTHPWGLADGGSDGSLLVTERDPGRLRRIDPAAGTTTEIDGVPAVDAAGQGGLLDVTRGPEGAWVYLTYAIAAENGTTTTRLGRGRLEAGGDRVTDFETLYTAEPAVDSSGHYGSRVAFGPEGSLYMTVGDRQFKNFGPDHVAQDRSNDLGTTLRLEPDGSIPDDNPFVDDAAAQDAIYSYGHRNAQGLDIHPETGAIWESEFGESDGDEINVIERGGNYGWPVATYACEYGTDDPVGDRPDEREEFVEPVHYWECGSGGFPPSGAAFYDGEAFPAWRGDLFLGNLAGEYLGRFAVDGRSVEEREPLLTDRGWRIRAIESAPGNGGLHVAIDGDPAPIVRLVPE